MVWVPGRGERLLLCVAFYMIACRSPMLQVDALHHKQRTLRCKFINAIHR